MAIDSVEADILNNSTPDNQKVEIGTEIKANQDLNTYQPVILTVPVVADATGGLAVTIPYAMTIYDVTVVCTVTNGAGTLKLVNGVTDITDAMVCAVDTTVVRAGTIDDSVSAITTATTMTVVANGAADRGIVYIMGAI